MTNEQAKKMLKAKLECLKRETSGTDFDCNNSNCDECSLCYEQGNMGEQKEALDMAIKALERQPCEDTISRQAAIKYLMTNMNWYDEDGYESDDDYKRECITELINGVPSAQPEIIRCRDCKHRYLDGMIWNCPFGLSGGEDFFCAYGAKEGDSDDE